MKKILKQLFIISCLIISYSSQTLNVYAYTIPKTSTHAVEVLLKANVPTDYTEKFEIAIYNEVTEETILTEYMQENNYCSEVLLPNKCTYHFMMMFKNEDYKSDIVESVRLDEETSIEINFNITSRDIPNNSPNADTGVIIGLENHTHGEEVNNSEIDEITGLKTPNAIYNEFIEKTSFLNDPANYNQYFNLTYTTDMEKELYLKYTDSGSEDKWNAMSDYEKFVYKEITLSPYLEIIISNDTYKNVDEFIKEAYDIESANFYDSMIPNRGKEVREALEEVWRWQYNYYQKNGTVYDFYNDKPWSDIMNTPTLQVQQMLEETVTPEEQELTDLQEEVMNNLTEEEQQEIMSAFAEEPEEMDELESNNGYDYLKDNFVIIILAAVIIILLFYIFINKKVSKNNKN